MCLEVMLYYLSTSFVYTFKNKKNLPIICNIDKVYITHTHIYIYSTYTPNILSFVGTIFNIRVYIYIYIYI